MARALLSDSALKPSGGLGASRFSRTLRLLRQGPPARPQVQTAGARQLRARFPTITNRPIAKPDLPAQIVELSLPVPRLISPTAFSRLFRASSGDMIQFCLGKMIFPLPLATLGSRNSDRIHLVPATDWLA
jgi:hypothetical protein